MFNSREPLKSTTQNSNSAQSILLNHSSLTAHTRNHSVKARFVAGNGVGIQLADQQRKVKTLLRRQALALSRPLVYTT